MDELIWRFDILIYRLFYWRWKKRLEDRPDIRKIFLDYLNHWEAIHREPAMGIGKPPRLRIPRKEERHE